MLVVLPKPGSLVSVREFMIVLCIILYLRVCKTRYNDHLHHYCVVL